MAGQNGKGSWPSRNNWGTKWSANYDAIDWKRKPKAGQDSASTPRPKANGSKISAV